MRDAVVSCARTCLELLVLGSLLLLPAPRALHAQQYGEDLSVRVIQVPVVVWRGTEPVTGLTKDDFEVFVNDVRQPIAYFDVLDFGREAQAGPEKSDSPRELRNRRLTLLLFDTVHSASIQLHRARPAVEQFIDAASDEDYFAVAVFTGSSSLRYIVPFTRDRLAILRAVATLERSRSGDALAIGMTPDERAMISSATGPSVTAAGVDRAYADDLHEGMRDFEETMDAMNDRAKPPSLGEALEREQDMRDQLAVQSWTAALADAADDLAPLEGTKQVAFFSAGIGLDYEEWNGTPRWPKLSIYTAAERMQRRFRRAGATLSIVDIAGLRAPGNSQGHRTPSAFFTAALGTGGRVLHGGGVSTLMRNFSDTTRVTYLLGLRPPANERDRNEIRVRVRNQPLFTEVSYRTGYSTATEDVRNVSGMLLADAMQNDIRFGDVTVALYTDPDVTGTVEVGVPSNELLTHAIDGAVSVDFYLYVFDESNNVAGWKHRRMTLNAEAARATMQGAELVRRERFELAPGTYTAKALVHITTRDLLGFTRKAFEVSAVAK